MCRRVSEYPDAKVQCMSIEDCGAKIQYDGLWANASLLHLPMEEIEKFIGRLDLILTKNVLNI